MGYIWERIKENPCNAIGYCLIGLGGHIVYWNTTSAAGDYALENMDHWL